MKVKSLISECDVKLNSLYKAVSIKYTDDGLPAYATITDDAGEKYLMINRGNITGEAYHSNEFELIKETELSNHYKAHFQDSVNGESFRFTMVYEASCFEACKVMAEKEFKGSKLLMIQRHNPNQGKEVV